MLLVRVTPLALAVTAAVWVLVSGAAVAANVAELEPAGTVTDDGTVRLALSLESETAKPPTPAASDSATVQVEFPGVFTGDVHDKLLNATGGMTVIEPPLPDEGIITASAEETTVPLAPIAIELLKGTGATVKVAVATTPLAIAVVFTPNTTHVVELGVEELQETDFPAAEAAVPITTET